MTYKTTAYVAVSDISIRWTVDDLLKNRSDYRLVGTCGESRDVVREIQILVPDVIFTDGLLGDTDAFFFSERLKLYMAHAAPVFVLFFGKAAGRDIFCCKGKMDYEIGYPSRQIYYSDLLDCVHRDCRRRREIRKSCHEYEGGISKSGSDRYGSCLVAEESAEFGRNPGISPGRKIRRAADNREDLRRLNMVNCLLDDLGVKRSLTGYGLLSDALFECVRESGNPEKSMKDIYLLLEIRYEMGHKNLERNIRTALGYMWKCGSRPLLMEVLSESSITRYNCPSNSIAIHRMAHYLIWKNHLY